MWFKNLICEYNSNRVSQNKHIHMNILAYEYKVCRHQGAHPIINNYRSRFAFAVLWWLQRRSTSDKLSKQNALLLSGGCRYLWRLMKSKNNLLTGLGLMMRTRLCADGSACYITVSREPTAPCFSNLSRGTVMSHADRSERIYKYHNKSLIKCYFSKQIVNSVHV